MSRAEWLRAFGTTPLPAAIHVVAATTPAEKIVITINEPEPARWEPDFKRRKT